MSVPTDQNELRDIIRAKYAAAATVTTDENATRTSSPKRSRPPA